MEAAGSGGTAELLARILVLAFTLGPAEVLAYMPAIDWRSGTGMVTWPVAGPGGAWSRIDEHRARNGGR